MDANWLDYWAQTRTMGKAAFLVKRGTMLGLIMFGVLVVVPRVFKMVDEPDWPIIPFIVFMLLGYAAGGLLWWANERSYQKLIQQNTSTPTEATDDDSAP